MPALTEIGALARRHDPDRFLCALFAPAAKREALFVLIGFNHELARAREAARLPLAALIRLQWWRDAVAEARSGQPARRHEVAAPLHAAIVAGALAPDDLHGMIDTREAEADGIADAAAFDAYLAGTAGGFAVAAGRLLGAPDALLPTLRTAGALYGLAGVLRNVPALAGQGRCLLPADALAATGLSPEAVGSGPALAGIVARLAAAGSQQVPSARSALRSLPRTTVAAALPLALAARDLRRLAAGTAVPPGRGIGDRTAIAWAGWRGRP